MIELFIALFGSIYYGVKIGQSNADKKRARARAEYRSAHFSRVTDGKLETEIKEMINNPKTREQVYELISDNLMAVFGKDFKRKFPLCRIGNVTCFDAKADNGYWAKQLLLAKHGKIGLLEYGNGYPIGFPPDAEKNRMICREIQRNLREAGSDLELVMAPNKSWMPGPPHMIFTHSLPF
ncbi:MAG: hypothetical protein J6Y20_11405 [Lachnospiraceae bacterium]|nr:hypothetical protein [Lachnospiraceae bacterium]